MSDVPVLICTGGALKGRHFEVPEGGLKIGRADDNDVVLLDDGTSRVHASLRLDNGTLWLRDEGSRNGVFVNGTRVTDHRSMKVGDVLRIANHDFEVRWRDEIPPDPTTEEKPAAEEEVDQTASRAWWPFGKREESPR